MARDFNGTTDRLDYGSVFDSGGQATTWSMWVKVGSLDAASQYLLIKQRSGDATVGGIVYIRGSADSWGFYDLWSTAMYRTSVTGDVVVGTTYHLLITHDGTLTASGTHIYVDGTEVSGYEQSVDGSGTASTNTGSFCVGGRSYDDARNFDGELWAVGVWDRELDAGERVALSAGYSPLFIPNGLQYAPDLLRDIRDPASGESGTADGTSVTPHGRIIYPATTFIGVAAVASGAITGTASGASTATGSLTGSGALAGTSSGVSTALADLNGAGALAGTVAGASTATGSLTGDGALAGTAAGVGTASGALSGGGDIALPAESDFSAETGNLDGDTLSQSSHKWATAEGSGWQSDGAGKAEGAAANSAVIVTDMPDTADISVKAIMAGNRIALTGRWVDSSNYYAARTDTSGNIDILRLIGGSSTDLVLGTNVVADSSELELRIYESGSDTIIEIYDDGTKIEEYTDSTVGRPATGKAGMRSYLSVAGTYDDFYAADYTLTGPITGTASGTSTATGSLTGSGVLEGTTSGVSTASGVLNGSGALAGTSAGTSTGTGTLLGAAGLSGTVTALATATGALAGSGALVGTSAGTSTASGVLQDGIPITHIRIELTVSADNHTLTIGSEDHRLIVDERDPVLTVDTEEA